MSMASATTAEGYVYPPSLLAFKVNSVRPIHCARGVVYEQRNVFHGNVVHQLEEGIPPYSKYIRTYLPTLLQHRQDLSSRRAKLYGPDCQLYLHYACRHKFGLRQRWVVRYVSTSYLILQRDGESCFCLFCPPMLESLSFFLTFG